MTRIFLENPDINKAATSVTYDDKYREVSLKTYTTYWSEKDNFQV